MSHPLSHSSTAAGDPQTPRAPRTPRSRRGTLQSGFSLLSRGEPKIWLTGGMLVICVAMIVGLLSLIVINGLATFWPRPLHWLVLSDGQMDIGEPQAIETNASQASTASASSARTDAVTATDNAATANSLASRFYRTANFDITGRHYRWFEPSELAAHGVVQPEWALVIERLSWGRMFALPSQLIVPIESGQPTEQDAGMLATNSLLKELTDELKSEDTPSDQRAEVGESLSELTAHLTMQLDQSRSERLRTAIGSHLQQPDGQIHVRALGSDEWQVVADAAQLESQESIGAARLVWDDPARILERMQPLIAAQSRNRLAIERAMHEISVLDRRLSDARVAVRQAELDTGRDILEEVDRVVPLVEQRFQLKSIEQRIQESMARAEQDFSDAERASDWQRLARKYLQTSLAPRIAQLDSELDAWRKQFEDQPAAIRDAALAYERYWNEVLERKLPLEEKILALRARDAGHEFVVSVPTDARTIALAESDSTQLQQGRWSSGAIEALSGHAIEPQQNSTRVEHLNEFVTLVSFSDRLGRHQWLWCVDRDAFTSASDSQSDRESPAAEKIWLLPSQRVVACDQIARLFAPNRMNVFGKLAVYGSRWREFLLEYPREANTEGGVFPAIWGTVVLTLIMTLAVVPFGVIAALYLREYTRSGPLVSLVRISINNLAGVPSIVYGVFGLAFFSYAIGAYIDGGPKNAEFGTLPPGPWYAGLALTVTVGVAAFLVSLLSSGPSHTLSVVGRWLARIAPWLWGLSLIGAGILIFRSPFFHGFYEARLPTPTFGKEGLLWASLTLALLTLPVVIVATEEALSAVPNSLREGSLACGASKWQTIHRIVLPHARPGILTGAILAMARGIGEVAPLMLVGALPVAPDLPLDAEFPFFHGSRSFMHLGYQIYWLGFQSQNSEASKPLVFTCTLLLILIVVALNLSAILLRARLRRRFPSNQF